MILKSTLVTVFALFISISCFAGRSIIVDFTISDTSVKKWQNVTFEDISNSSQCGSSIDSWLWDFGPGASPATANTEDPGPVRYSTPGTKSVKLTVTSNQCNPGVRLKTIEVIDEPIPTMSQWTLLICGLLITSLAVGRIWMAVKKQA